jgi:N-acetylglucosaminyl-diphospho-decaprenol L-rhamnosyltransferase
VGSTETQLSAIVVSTNEAESVIEECLSTLRHGLPDCEIVLVDNGRSEDRLRALVDRFDNLRWVHGHGNVGYGRGNNIGVAAASGTHVMIVNPDTRLVSADHAQLAKLLGCEPFGIAAPMHLDEDGEQRYHVYPGDNWLVHFFAGQILAPLYPRELAGRERLSSPEKDGAWIGGSFVLFRADEFTALGGFDERFFLYYEDRDITDRYRKAGLPVRTDPSLVAAHAGGGAFASEEAGILRSVWRILGWVQYVHIWDGHRPAAAVLRMLLAAYGGIAALLLAVSRRRSSAGRLQRKGRELAAVRRNVLGARSLLPDVAADSYPDVLRILARGSDQGLR